jgi:hypothetical protein
VQAYLISFIEIIMLVELALAVALEVVSIMLRSRGKPASFFVVWPSNSRMKLILCLW